MPFIENSLMPTILSQIEFPSDLKNKSINQLMQLAKELREFIVEIVSTKEGHLGASLGVVELTIALHYVFDTPLDKIVWDVGHQAYGHKILTGRKNAFATNRQQNGISGFPKREESSYDAFGVGHSSTAISAALGMALASKINGNFEQNNIAVVGDASIVSGMAFEALNHAGATDANLLVILNDNAIGIDPSVGALKSYLAKVKNNHENAIHTTIAPLNIEYKGPIDGHDLPLLIQELQELKKSKKPRLLHLKTIKGKGLKQAEELQTIYHAPGKFDSKTGELLPKINFGVLKYAEVFGQTLLELAKQNDKIMAITPAMPSGSCLWPMMQEFPDRALDVGIAEQHAVTLSAGLATQGIKVFCVIYSTFLQRAYDQIIHDVALQNLPVIFCIDRAGLVGEDGATHQGVFDIAYLNTIPNIRILAPQNAEELRNVLYTLSKENHSAIAIRYPRGNSNLKSLPLFQTIDLSLPKILKSGKKIAVLTTGVIASQAEEALKFNSNDFSLIHFLQIKPLDYNKLHDIFKEHQVIVTIEEGSLIGGFGSVVSQFAAEFYPTKKVFNQGVANEFIEQATQEQQLVHCGLDFNSLRQFFKEILKNEI